MLADLHIVNPHLRLPIHSAEVEQDALVLPRCGYGELALIPQCVVCAEGLHYAREARLYGKWHEDVAIHLLWLRLVQRADCIVPQAVEVLPALTLHNWARILWQYIIWVEVFAPLGFQVVTCWFPLRRCGGKSHTQQQ